MRPLPLLAHRQEKRKNAGSVGLSLDANGRGVPIPREVAALLCSTVLDPTLLYWRVNRPPISAVLSLSMVALILAVGVYVFVFYLK